MKRLIALALGALIALATSALAQSPATKLDASLDNLVHAEGYPTAALGTLGAVVEAGHGPVDMLLVSGFGVGASGFAAFQQRNAERYHMLAITLPGFEGTAAPPMPPAGTSYAAQTWTNGAIEGLVKLIANRKLDRPVLVGHSLNGTQVAVRVAADHPDLVRAVVLLAGTPAFEPAKPTPYWPQHMSLADRVALMDQSMAPRWFKFVTRETWVANNFVAADYSVDAERGRHFADLANAPPLPVLIRYLCEFHASDARTDLERVTAPLLVIEPGFTAERLAEPGCAYLPSFFDESWKGVLEKRPQTEVLKLQDAGMLVMDDKPAEVDKALAEFLARQ